MSAPGAIEVDAQEACELVALILSARARGSTSTNAGNSADDLLAAIEEAERALEALREAMAGA